MTEELQPNNEPPLVDLANVRLSGRAGRPVFTDLNLVVRPGHSVFVTGPAGSGKTSLVDLILGRRFADSGSVEVFGRLLKRGRNRLIQKTRLKIGGVGGPFELLPSLTVTRNLELPLILAGDRKKNRREMLQKYLSEFSLLKQASLYPSELTRVENMMALFARASVASQPLLIIDEPLAGLDSQTYARVLDYLFKVVVSGRSMIMLGSEPPNQPIPQTEVKRLVDGELK
jgi:putative ABC transport system ATP-binding protein